MGPKIWTLSTEPNKRANQHQIEILILLEQNRLLRLAIMSFLRTSEKVSFLKVPFFRMIPIHFKLSVSNWTYSKAHNTSSELL